jgi:hypothetical protein
LLRKKNFIFILHFLFDLGEPLRTKKARIAGFLGLASGYSRFASLIPHALRAFRYGALARRRYYPSRGKRKKAFAVKRMVEVEL